MSHHTQEGGAAATLPTYSPRFTEEYAESVLVTGGVGFVGSHTVEALLRLGKKVVVYDIFNSETTVSDEKREVADTLRRTADEFEKDGAKLDIVHGDVRDREKLLGTIREHDITACIHVGGMVDDRRSVYRPDEYVDVNVRGTAILLDTLGGSGVKMVVQASTRSVFGQREDNDVMLTEAADRRPVNPYGASKVGADAMAHCYSHLHKMNVTLVRIFATYGPRGRPDMIPRILCENVAEGIPIRKFGDGTATRTWIYISDIVSAFLAALHNPCDGFAEFNTGAPNSTTLNEMIACAEKVIGKKAIIDQCEVPPGDAHTVGHPSYNLIRKTLGWEPKVGVEEGLRLTYLDYVRRKEEGAVDAMAKRLDEQARIAEEEKKMEEEAEVAEEKEADAALGEEGRKTSLEVVVAAVEAKDPGNRRRLARGASFTMGITRRASFTMVVEPQKPAEDAGRHGDRRRQRRRASIDETMMLPYFVRPEHPFTWENKSASAPKVDRRRALASQKFKSFRV